VFTTNPMLLFVETPTCVYDDLSDGLGRWDDAVQLDAQRLVEGIGVEQTRSRFALMETERALDVLTSDGTSRSGAIRRAILDTAICRELATDLRRVVLQTPLGEPGGINIAEELLRRAHRVPFR